MNADAKWWKIALALPLLGLHGVIYNPIGRVAAARGLDFGPLIETPLDALVPCWTIFVLPYLYAWLVPVALVGYLILKAEIGAAVFCRVFAALLVLMIVAYSVWVVFPVQVHLRVDHARLEDSWLGQLVLFNYNWASKWNACPSFHVTAPWFLYRATRLYAPRLPALVLPLVLAVVVSTVLIRIHYLADIAVGLLVGELVFRLVLQRFERDKTFATVPTGRIFAAAGAVYALGGGLFVALF